MVDEKSEAKPKAKKTTKKAEKAEAEPVVESEPQAEEPKTEE